MPLELENVQSGYNLAVINENFQRIEDTWDEKLDRVNSGSFYNQMEQELDMNSNHIINNPVPTEETHLVRLKELNDLVFNAEATGVIPIVQPRQVGDGVSTVFDAPNDYVVSAATMFISIDGLLQRPFTDYDVLAANQVTFTEPVPNLATVDITYFEPNIVEDPDVSLRTAKATGTPEARTLGDRFADVVNVKDFGAVGDGVTDDTSAFLAAESSGETIFVPHSEDPYLVNADIDNLYGFTEVQFTGTGNKRYFNLNKNPHILLGGAIRHNGTSFEVLDDSDHKAFNLTSVTEPDDASFQVNYSTDGDTVGTMLAVVDQELAPYGIHLGASAQKGNSIFRSYAPCTLYVNNINSVTASPLWTGNIGISQPTPDSVVLTHTPRALAVDPPVISNVIPGAGSYHREKYHVAWGSNTTTIYATGSASGRVSVSGSTASVNDSKNLAITATVSNGSVTVNHPAGVGGSVVNLTAFNSDLRPEISSVTSSSFIVNFRDSNGNLITIPDDRMQFYFTREGSYPVNMDANTRFAVDLGLCQVKNANVGNVALNNYWLIGANNV